MSYRNVTFEAEIAVELDETVRAEDEEIIRRTVQEEIGHTGAVVTDVIYVDAST